MFFKLIAPLFDAKLGHVWKVAFDATSRRKCLIEEKTNYP